MATIISMATIASQRRLASLRAHVTAAAATAAAPPSLWDELGWKGLSGRSAEERLARLARAIPQRSSTSAPGQHLSFRTVDYQKRGNVAVITQSRPHVLNARNVQMYWDLFVAMEEAELDPDVVAIVITGAGRYFCSGADGFGGSKTVPRDRMPDPPRVAQLKALPVRPRDSSTWPQVQVVMPFINCSKLLIGAVNGPAVGEGFSSLLHCDVIYAAETATFWGPFHRFAVVPEFCSTLLLKEKIGSNVANEMLLLSAKKTAAELHRAGLVNAVLPAGDVFLASVLERVQAGIALSGHPTVRRESMGLVKGMLRSRDRREELMVLNMREQEICSGWHGRDKARHLNLAFYAAQLPGGKKKKKK